MICGNCQSTKHEACCARCGCVILGKPHGAFCSPSCEREQVRDDKLSDQIERNQTKKGSKRS